jgi:hypothetical protein
MSHEKMDEIGFCHPKTQNIVILVLFLGMTKDRFSNEVFPSHGGPVAQFAEHHHSFPKWNRKKRFILQMLETNTKLVGSLEHDFYFPQLLG